MIMNSKMPRVISKDLILCPEEFCYHVYMPIKVGKIITLPDNLMWTAALVDSLLTKDWLEFDYWYLTVKHMWICGYGNREGWHCDGFGSNDVNYIWSDCVPTEFCVQSFDLDEDHNKSLIQMEEQVKEENCVLLEPNILVRLTPDMVHRPTFSKEPVLRTFIKISCSNEVYNLKGNASNPNLKTVGCDKVDRQKFRNHPVGKL